MATRFNANPRENYGVKPLESGYSHGDTSSELVIPSVGIEDVDIGIFTLFDKEIPFAVGGEQGGEYKKVPIIFAGGEKWALLKKNRAIRDKNNSLILPIIAIGRTGISQTTSEDLTGRGMNQHSGEIVVRRKLDKTDRGYQNLINRIFLKHQSGLAVPSASADTNQLTTIRPIGELEDDGVIAAGGLLMANRLNNIYETLVIPSPQFITANYEVIIWTQYTHHMNQILETMFSSFLPQTKGWQIDTPKGYWFVATVVDDVLNAETNFQNMTDGERMIKYKFNVKVPAYIFASSAPGVPVPVKRYISSPEVSFSTGLPSSELSEGDTLSDPFIGADDPTLPLADRHVRNNDQRQNGKTRLFVVGDTIDPNDPALLSLPRGRAPANFKKIVSRNSNGGLTTRFVRISSVNANTGETVYSSGTDLGDLSIVVIEDLQSSKF